MADWIAPVSGGLTQGYGVENAGYEAGYHTGLDYGVATGTRIVSVQKGKVVEAGWSSAYGNYVKIRHPNGYFSLYAHLNNLNVRAGQSIQQGGVIGRSGSTGNSTGPHLHFEIRAESGYGSDINPMKFIGGNGTYVAEGGGGKSTGGTGGKPVKTTKDEYGFSRQFLDEHPEVEKLVNTAFKQQWTPQRFEAEIKNTEWWRKTSEARKQWDKMSSETPGEAKDQIEKKRVDLAKQAAALGIDVNNPKIRDAAERALRSGWSEGQIVNWLARQFDITPDKLTKKQEKNMSPKEERQFENRQEQKGDQTLTGTAGEAYNTLNAMARDYGMNLSTRSMERYVQGILRGEETPETLRGKFIRQAKALYPTLEEQLNEGLTVDDMLSPYRDIAAQELGTVPDAIDPDNKKWTAALTEGANGMMTADEWQRHIRNDKRYGFDNSNTGRELAAQTTIKFAELFGAL